MGFLDTVRRVLHMENHPARDVERAWGLNDDTVVAESEEDAPPEPKEAGLYDRTNWQKKMKRILEGLPATRPQWAELMTEAKALQLDPAWIKECSLEQFAMLVRRAVSDRHFSETEHKTLDLARDLIGLSEDQAEAILHSIVAEAQTFFGQDVRKG
jgi:adenylate kinase family enzyme